MSANNSHIETFKILSHDNNTIFTFIINSNNTCESYYKGTHLFGNIIDKQNNSIIILWKHSKKPNIREYIKYDGKNYYIHNTQTTIPEDWTPDDYKEINPDLSEMSSIELLKHYLEYRQRENRTFQTEPLLLPEDFDPKTYKILNPDLYNFNDYELKRHYLDHGIKEKRTYKLITDKNSNPKSNPIFINHDCQLTGAPIFLYDYVTYLKNANIIKNPIIVEAYPNNVFNNYDINKLYHDNDPNKLLEIIKDINPVFIYNNSLTTYYYHLKQFKDYWYKTYFHFHETLNNINKDLLSQIKDEKILVVADRIKEEFETIGCTNISIFPPFIPQEKIFRIQNLSSKPKQTHTHNKITIGMSGSIGDRKNFGLFYKLAKACPDYEFLWIGGDEDWKSAFYKIYNYEPESLDNFTHVPYTKNPYPYFVNLDYFFLTSKNDPCPIVVLENLALNNRIIVIKDNIFYQHDKLRLKENLIEIEENEDTKIIKKFKSLKLKKYNRNIDGERYIKKSFSKPKIIIKNKNIQNYLIFSLYQASRDNDTEINYFVNLINNFNINNKSSYKVFININIDNGYEISLSKDKHKFFYAKYQEALKDIINLENIELSINKGWDLNGLLKYIPKIYNDKNISNNSKVAYLHNKSNLPWRAELNKIFYLQDNEIEPYDTIVSDRFFVECPPEDLDREIMKKYKFFGNLYKKQFKYVQGTIFITRLNNLKTLYDLNSELQSNLTNIDTKNNFWIESMKNNDLFNKYYQFYLDNEHNSPIDLDSKIIIEKGLANNYIDLYSSFGKKGIPDLHFEHALERYIGYLISDNKKVLTI
jgi:hypothetical protein